MRLLGGFPSKLGSNLNSIQVRFYLEVTQCLYFSPVLSSGVSTLGLIQSYTGIGSNTDITYSLDVGQRVPDNVTDPYSVFCTTW